MHKRSDKMGMSFNRLSFLPLPISFKFQNPNARKSKLFFRTHQWRKRTITTACSSSTSTSEEALLAKSDLLGLISDEERGIKTAGNPSKRSKIMKAIEAMELLGRNSVTTDSSSLSATWRMLWTTEKEQLFIIKNAHFFGTQTGDVLQVIDVDGGVLNNVITFPPSGVFFVRSNIQVVSPQRVNFRFTSAVLRGENWEFPLPPFGQGWFESVYLDDEIRVVKDVQEDYLVVERAPYGWKE